MKQSDQLVIKEKEYKGTRLLIVDTSKSQFRNIPWSDLGDWGKRKADNFIVLSNSNELRKKIQPCYVH
jgi:hypothetical protein